jgi:acyl-CoA thioesterase-1
MDSNVLLPEPDAPKMATDSPAATEKSISRKIDSGPLASLTVLLTWLTEIIELNMQIPLWQHQHFNRLVLSVLIAGLWFVLGALNAFANANLNSVSSANQTTPTVLIVGDSLSAEYGLTRGTGWIQLMSKQASDEKISVNLVNASISGDTSSGGVSRLPVLLQQHRPQIVVIELGGNDALRGLSLAMTLNNLNSMALASKKAGAQVMLVAIQVPPNYGEKYRQQMDLIYEKVAKETGSQLNRQFLKGVADNPDPLKFFQADRIHPNEAAQTFMMKNIWPQLKKMLRST